MSQKEDFECGYSGCPGLLHPVCPSLGPLHDCRGNASRLRKITLNGASRGSHGAVLGLQPSNINSRAFWACSRFSA